MSTDIRLDPERMADLEPKEGDEREQLMLSPSAVPQKLAVDFTAPIDRPQQLRVSAIRFWYGRADAGMPPEQLDGVSGPRVTVVRSTLGPKVLELKIEPAVGPDELKDLVVRIRTRASSLKESAMRLSYRMAASVITEWIIPLALEAPALKPGQIISRDPAD